MTETAPVMMIIKMMLMMLSRYLLRSVRLPPNPSQKSPCCTALCLYSSRGDGPLSDDIDASQHMHAKGWVVTHRSTAPLLDPVQDDRIRFGVLLGAGSFGKVYRGWWADKEVAIKVILFSVKFYACRQSTVKPVFISGFEKRGSASLSPRPGLNTLAVACVSPARLWLLALKLRLSPSQSEVLLSAFWLHCVMQLIPMHTRRSNVMLPSLTAGDRARQIKRGCSRE